MKTTAFVKSTNLSPLTQVQFIKHGGELTKSKETNLAAILPLTSLIDAFSIIVIYLLIGTQSGGIDKDIPKLMQLPVAEAGQSLQKEVPIVRIQKGAYFINDMPVVVSQLGARLADLKKSLAQEDMEILIQADQAMDYADLDPILRAGSEAGIQKLKFAVLTKK